LICKNCCRFVISAATHKIASICWNLLISDLAE